VHQLKNTWVGGQANLLEHVAQTEVNVHHTPSIYLASHDANHNNVEAYFQTNSLHSTGRKYTFCVLLEPVYILCTIVVCCMLGLS